MTALVTGATGFVGSHLLDELLARGHEVRALVRNGEKALELERRGVETVVGDVREQRVVRQAVARAELIYHCAAASSLCPDEEIRQTNSGGVRNLLEAARESGVGRVIVMSSINVLGSHSFDRVSEETPVRRSGDAHADVKIEAEELAKEYIVRDGMDITILRPGLIYGPGQGHLAKLARAIQLGKFAYIGSPENVTPLVFVSDMIQAMILAAETAQASGRVYHIADGSRTMIADLVGELADLLHCPPPSRVVPYALARSICGVCSLLRLPSPITRATLRFLGTSRYVDIRRAKQELGYSPQVGLREG